jgi:hypothetical protein
VLDAIQERHITGAAEIVAGKLEIYVLEVTLIVRDTGLEWSGRETLTECQEGIHTIAGVCQGQPSRAREHVGDCDGE